MLWGRYASRRGEARFPTLWDGRVFSVCPSIQGPSGVRLWDTSGRSNHGTLTNMDAPTDWVRSRGQYALDFDGVNDYALIGTTSALNPESISFSAWIRPTAVSGDYTVYAMSNAGATIYRGLWVTAGALRFAWGSVAATFRLYTTAASTIAANTWQHVAAGHTGTGAPLIWINGISMSTTLTSSGVNTLPATQQSDIGRLGNNFYFQGQIDDVAVFNRQLTGGEARLLAVRRGIAYEARRDIVFGSSGFSAYWARRQNQIIGGGV